MYKKVILFLSFHQQVRKAGLPGPPITVGVGPERRSEIAPPRNTTVIETCGEEPCGEIMSLLSKMHGCLNSTDR